MQVTINNNAPGVDVTTQQTGPTSLEVTINRARAAIAADIRSGGNSVSNSIEQAYGLGRGNAAAF